MNADQIFELFSNPDYSEDENFIDIYNHPLFNIGKFKKVILNIKNYNYNLYATLHEQNPDLSKEDIVFLGEKILFNKAYSYISEINVNDLKIQEIIKTFGDKELKECFEKAIKYFEKLEEYEKCAFLNKFIVFI